MNKINFGIFLLVALFLVSSCEDPDPVDSCDTTSMTYTSDIKSILDASCAVAGCHDMGSAVGGLNDYMGAEAFANSGRLLGAINHQEGFKPMPYPAGSAKISQCNIDKITAWMADGFPE